MHRMMLFAMIIFIPYISFANLPSKGSSKTISIINKYNKYLIGAPVYIQLFKEERILDLYINTGKIYELLSSYKICSYSGGLGPKQRQGDLKSPEGFYIVQRKQLKSNSRFYRAIDIGFPNIYDRIHGYNGRYLMIHGACVSIGCYAMTDKNINEIFQFVANALTYGQPYIQISIYPFKMTDINMQRHKHSNHIDFWKQLKPGFDYFQKTNKPPIVSVINNRYIINFNY